MPGPAMTSAFSDPRKVSLPIQGAPVVAARWLRDRCACPQCRVPTTNERLLDPVRVGSSIRVDELGREGEVLVVSFSDGHRSRFDVAAVTRDLERIGTADPVGRRTPWRLPDPEPLTVVAEADLDDPAMLLGALDVVADRGAVVVHGLDRDVGAAVALAERIGHVLPSNYGPAWEVEATVSPASAVDSQRGLAVHTDLPYRATPPGLQVNLFACADVAGGASTLADGIAVSERLRAEDPTGWRLLTEVRFTYDYVRGDVRFHSAEPLIRLDAAGRYGVIRRAPDLVGVPLVGADDTDAVYSALARWNELLDDPAHQVEHRLEAGDAIIFDNHRLLHGRTAFELGASGRRHLVGCYLDADELTNRRNVLRHDVLGVGR